jgi:hypothetical protein
MEGGRGATCTSSGHAAQLLTLFALMAPGDTIVASNRLYGECIYLRLQPRSHSRPESQSYDFVRFRSAHSPTSDGSPLRRWQPHTVREDHQEIQLELRLRRRRRLRAGAQPFAHPPVGTIYIYRLFVTAWLVLSVTLLVEVRFSYLWPYQVAAALQDASLSVRLLFCESVANPGGVCGTPPRPPQPTAPQHHSTHCQHHSNRHTD